MPEIKPNEKRSSYIARCVNYVMKKEGLNEKAALGKCEGIFDQHEKNKRAKSSNALLDGIAQELLDAGMTEDSGKNES